MYTGKIYSLKAMVLWTRYESLFFIFYISLWVAAYFFLDIEWLTIPWTPVALIGTAVAFVIGFQNNAVYGRIWEARKIWGGVVNTSRTFGMFVQDMVSNEYCEQVVPEQEINASIKTLTYRHIAWMTALRYSMRQLKPWETTSQHRTNTEWGIKTPESQIPLAEALEPYLPKEDLEYVLSKGNKQTAVLYLQSHHLRKLKEAGLVWEFAFLQLEGVLEELFTLQGKSERIKNFPYPRQYATLNHFFMWTLLLLLPMALVPQFLEIGQEIALTRPLLGMAFIWFCIPIYMAVAWIFHTMERIGRTGENPFEGTANDVPISTIARGIEIDLRQNLGEDSAQIPAPFPADYGVQF
ncbi:bestrophin family protein [Gilvibacter sediminis]|uniref:bestrophin family protein n=1 Tax=Gilvibacter sediminis TaxID=379071 RepID=UPI002350E8FE|nr:bestrophin family ion channel [Gilvibacter sediminis]MDC7997755.1 bestrophin family ion channel [Gilvibacter sediminis]